MEPIFPFPFEPYAIQTKFMKELYHTIDNCELGVFESPTGTGKSLSICCGALQWMRDYNKKIVDDLEIAISNLKLQATSSAQEDWLQEEYEKLKKNQEVAAFTAKLANIKKRREYFDDLKTKVKQFHNLQQQNIYLLKEKKVEESSGEKNLNDLIEDHDLILDEYSNSAHSDESEAEEKEDEDEIVKIYISSRTHSQLSQFVGEIKRTAFKDDVRVITLASRQHFCINSDVVKLKNINLINERCLDLQKSSAKSTSKGNEGKVLKKTKTKSCTSCPYYNQNNIKKLKDRLVVEIMDMEDLVKNGKELKACPYYATRMALDDAQVILISHAGIVSAGARNGVSLKLKQNVLILDEAHGLTAALENAHSAPVSEKQLMSVKKYLQFYINKYRDRLSSRNLLSLNQISYVVGKLLGMLISHCEVPKKSEEDTKILTLEDFVIKAEIDHMNLQPLIEFSRNTRLAPKLHGFSLKFNTQIVEDEAAAPVKMNNFEEFLKNISKNKTVETPTEVVKVDENKTNVQPNETSAGTGLYAILDFLDMLCARSENGRVLIQRSNKNGQLKYLLLNAAEHFTDVVKQCRSVIVAGGTMEPISEFQSLLCGNELEYKDKINVVRCDHVVPPDNVLGICLSKGPTNLSLNFSFDNRQSKQLLDEIGRILRNVSNIVPGGVICFLPSYSYEQIVYEHLNKTNVLDVISKRKQIFREPKSAADVDKVLNKFAAAVKNKDKGNNGALLFSVVGGKLSEGLNFSDDLGRCVLVVGMPYPNVKSAELQEKINYISRTEGGTAGNLYYENLCMKAVNQCIGRAVRHANDYACVILVDERYSRPQTVSALPSFVQKSLMTNCNFGPSIGNIAKFFSRHKNK